MTLEQWHNCDLWFLGGKHAMETNITVLNQNYMLNWRSITEKSSRAVNEGTSIVNVWTKWILFFLREVTVPINILSLIWSFWLVQASHRNIWQCLKPGKNFTNSTLFNSISLSIKVVTVIIYVYVLWSTERETHFLLKLLQEVDIEMS